MAAKACKNNQLGLRIEGLTSSQLKDCNIRPTMLHNVSDKHWPLLPWVAFCDFGAI